MYILTNRSCRTVSPLTSAVYCRPQGEALQVLDTLSWYTSKRTHQQTLHLSPTMCSPYKKGSGHSLTLHFQANPCSFTWWLEMSFVVWLDSDSMYTTYDLRQQHGTKVFPYFWPVYWWCLRWAACSSCTASTASIPGPCGGPCDISLQETCISVSSNRCSRCFYFLSQNNKLYSPLRVHELFLFMSMGPIAFLDCPFM